MALILSIDTAMENAVVCIAEDACVLCGKTSSRQMDHASWMHRAIREMLQETGRNINELQAVAVTSGPGSYTGLRVGLSAAKGLCYALNIPMIIESTLHLIACGVKNEIEAGAPQVEIQTREDAPEWRVLICPMIDARRMEVFTALYDNQLVEQEAPSAMILDEHSFQHFFDHHIIVFAGNGSVKWKAVCHHPGAVFLSSSYTMNDLALIASSKFKAHDFTDIAYSEPFYLKNVYTGTKDA
jgi:tRNA threonylcarbamoyladenosine biosynthesis protein TsaB